MSWSEVLNEQVIDELGPIQYRTCVCRGGRRRPSVSSCARSGEKSEWSRRRGWRSGILGGSCGWGSRGGRGRPGVL